MIYLKLNGWQSTGYLLIGEPLISIDIWNIQVRLSFNLIQLLWIWHSQTVICTISKAFIFPKQQTPDNKKEKQISALCFLVKKKEEISRINLICLNPHPIILAKWTMNPNSPFHSFATRLQRFRARASVGHYSSFELRQSQLITITRSYEHSP